MLYRFISLLYDGTEISFSEIMTNEDKSKSIRIYIDQWNEEAKAYNVLEFYLPNYNITQQKGFSQEKVDEHIRHIKHLEDMVWECAAEKGGS